MIDKLLQLPTREKVGLFFALGLVLLYVVDLTVAKPLIRHVDALDASIQIEQERLDRYLKTLSFEASVDEQYLKVKDLIGVSGPEQEAVEIFKNEVDEIALRHGVRLRSMRHLAPQPTEYLVTYIIEVGDFEAETSALIRFLDDVSQAPGLLRTRQLSLSSQSTDTQVNGSMVITKVMTLAEGETTP